MKEPNKIKLKKQLRDLKKPTVYISSYDILYDIKIINNFVKRWKEYSFEKEFKGNGRWS